MIVSSTCPVSPLSSTLVVGLQRGKFPGTFDVKVSDAKRLPKLCIRLLGLGQPHIFNLQHLTISSIRLGNGPPPLQQTLHLPYVEVRWVLGCAPVA